jgi:hypothetical protein
MSSVRIPTALRHKIVARAQGRCAYCRTAEAYSGAPLEIDHIIPSSAGGSSEESNLCLACRLCNSFKGVQTHALDSETNQRVALFNPRTQNWSEHFTWSQNGDLMIGLTPCGRVTVNALQMNNAYIVPARRRWVSVGWHPPRE